jgi:hypothetical protein
MVRKKMRYRGRARRGRQHTRTNNRIIVTSNIGTFAGIGKFFGIGQFTGIGQFFGIGRITGGCTGGCDGWITMKRRQAMVRRCRFGAWKPNRMYFGGTTRTTTRASCR